MWFASHGTHNYFVVIHSVNVQNSQYIDPYPLLISIAQCEFIYFRVVSSLDNDLHIIVQVPHNVLDVRNKTHISNLIV